MTVPVNLPHFDLTECANSEEASFLTSLHERAIADNWRADCWWSDPIVVTVTISDVTEAHNLVLRTLRIDFDGKSVTFGPDRTHQLVDDLDPNDDSVHRLVGSNLMSLAKAAADWIAVELRRPILRHEWNRVDNRGVRPVLWLLADSGEGLAMRGRRVLEPPDRVVHVR